MHTKDAAHAGETSPRLNLVAAWREAKVFSDAERAARELTEQGTRIAEVSQRRLQDSWASVRGWSCEVGARAGRVRPSPGLANYPVLRHTAHPGGRIGHYWVYLRCHGA
jgi:hypothetical protein